MSQADILTYLNEAATKGTPVNQIIADLDVLTSQLSIRVPNAAANAQTLIYSGPLEHTQGAARPLGTGDVAEFIGRESLGADGKIHVITIGETEAGKVVGSRQFSEALYEAVGKKRSKRGQRH